MISSPTSFILGFNGCDIKTRDNLVSKKTDFKISLNTYDWLGHGAYFWENNPTRALSYAEHLKKNPKRTTTEVKDPAVVGAIIDLGNCLDLLQEEGLQILKENYKFLVNLGKKNGFVLPQNKKPINEEKDLLKRDLDCAVVELAHLVNYTEGRKQYDTVRAPFFEGDGLYEKAGFSEKNHIQICVRNPNCIKGFFRLHLEEKNVLFPELEASLEEKQIIKQLGKKQN